MATNSRQRHRRRCSPKVSEKRNGVYLQLENKPSRIGQRSNSQEVRLLYRQCRNCHNSGEGDALYLCKECGFRFCEASNCSKHDTYRCPRCKESGSTAIYAFIGEEESDYEPSREPTKDDLERKKRESFSATFFNVSFWFSIPLVAFVLFSSFTDLEGRYGLNWGMAAFPGISTIWCGVWMFGEIVGSVFDQHNYGIPYTLSVIGSITLHVAAHVGLSKIRAAG